MSTIDSGHLEGGYPLDSPLKTIEANHCTIWIDDTEKQKRFFQSIFDMPIRAYQGDTTPVYTVSGNSTLVMFDYTGNPDAQALGVTPQVDHTCYALENYNFNKVRNALSGYGLEDLGDQLRPTGPLQHYYTSRRPDRGGEPTGSFEIYMTDPDGLVVQVQDLSYCGGGRTNGEICGTAENPSR